MKKTILLIKTEGCSACKCMEHILERVNSEDKYNLDVNYFQEAPEFIKTNVKLTDFPTTVFIDENNVIKYHFVGTKSVAYIKRLLNDLKF